MEDKPLRFFDQCTKPGERVTDKPELPQQGLAMLYGVGLLLPELLLIAGAIAWLRRRAA